MNGKKFQVERILKGDKVDLKETTYVQRRRQRGKAVTGGKFSVPVLDQRWPETKFETR